MKRLLSLCIVALLLLIPTIVLAEDDTPGSSWAIGLQRTSYLTLGPTITYDFNDRFSLQGFLSIYDFDEGRSVMGIRGIYRFLNLSQFNLYAVASYGTMTVSAFFPDSGKETASFYGAAAGIEYDTRSFLSKDLPLFLVFELGMEGTAGFQYFDTNYITFTFTPGILVRF